MFSTVRFLISTLHKIVLKDHEVGRHRKVRKCWIEVSHTSLLLNCIMESYLLTRLHTHPLSSYTIFLIIFIIQCVQGPASCTLLKTCAELRIIKILLMVYIFLIYIYIYIWWQWVWFLNADLRWRDGITMMLWNWGKRVKAEQCL